LSTGIEELEVHVQCPSVVSLRKRAVSKLISWGLYVVDLALGFLDDVLSHVELLRSLTSR
jgi:hypothetical protein